ncbi:MAG TPA: hypothetical protein VN256_26735 [Pyrinomonadaceae bacterium]|nr:hypothetical protein [Pyrinomonadaceae bacterium]
MKKDGKLFFHPFALILHPFVRARGKPAWRSSPAGMMLDCPAVGELLKSPLIELVILT